MKTTVHSSFSFHNLGKGLNALFVKLFGSDSQKIALDVMSNLDIDVDYSVEMSAEEYQKFNDTDRAYFKENLDNLSEDLKKVVNAIADGVHVGFDRCADEYKHFYALDDQISQFDDNLYEEQRKRAEAKDKARKEREEKEKAKSKD